MSYQRGSNAGVTGIVDLPSVNGGAHFFVQVYGFQRTREAKTKYMLGRGVGEVVRVRTILGTGTLLLTGEMVLDGSPEPQPFVGQQGTVTIQFINHTGKKVTIPVQIVRSEISYNEPKQDVPRVSLLAVITGQEVWEGFETIPDGETELKTTELYPDQLGKVKDPDNLEDGVWTYIDICGIGDDDTSEFDQLGKLLTIWAKPHDDLKARNAKLASRDLFGCVFSIEWRRTTTGEDIENNGTFALDDPYDLASQGQATQLNGIPDVPTGLYDRGVRTQELNDAVDVYTRLGGLRTTQDDIEMPGSWVSTDPDGLVSEGQETQVYTTGGSVPASTIPTGQKLVSTTVQEENRLKSKVIYRTGVNTSSDRLLNEHQRDYKCPSDLEDYAFRAKIYTDATGAFAAVPTDATDKPSGSHWHLDGRTMYPLIRDATDVPTTALFVWKYSRSDAADRLVFQNSNRFDDAGTYSLEDSAVTAYLTTTGTDSAQSVPGFVTGLKTVGTWRQQLNDGTGRYLHREFFGRETSDEKVVNSNSHTLDDPQDLEDEQVVASFSGYAAATADLQIRSKTQRTVGGRTFYVTRLAKRTTEDDVTYQGHCVSPLFDNQVNTLVTIITSSSALATIATTYFADWSDDIEFVTLRVRRLTPTKVELTSVWATNDMIVRGQSIGSREFSSARIATSGEYLGQVEVYCRVIRDNLDFRIEVVETVVHRTRMRFQVRRRVLAVDDGPLPMYWEMHGKANRQTLFGLPVGTVIFDGTDVDSNGSVTPYPALMHYAFSYDSLGFFTGSDVQPSIQIATANSSSSTLYTALNAYAGKGFMWIPASLLWSGTETLGHSFAAEPVEQEDLRAIGAFNALV